MKTLFLAISSAYIHTLLAPRYLAENSRLPVKIYETNVNVDAKKTIEYIENENPDVIAFSCYIFNIAYIKSLLPEVKKRTDAKIVLGGYEAAFNEKELLPLCDFIIKGEGDFAFGELLEKIENNTVCAPLVIEAGTVKDMDSIISPYSDEYLSLGKTNKIIYAETCRGCPFGCAYCMSANTHGVRSFSLPRIFEDFDKIMKFSPSLVKLVDRTFNYDKKRAASIFSYLIDNYAFSGTRFHFEMAPELFDEELFSVISRAPKNLFQFEIGVQSYKKETLAAVNRRADIDTVDKNIRRLIDMGNCPIHVDLIAGLPCETKEEFLLGFDRLYSLKPDCLQAGFLKILRGSLISEHREGYVVGAEPPYEIVSSPSMTAKDLDELRLIADALDLYYNSGRFAKSISFLTAKLPPHEVFYGISRLFAEKGTEMKFFSASRQSDLLFEYGKTVLSEIDAKTLEFMIYDDFIASGNTRKWHKWLKR